MTCRVCGHEFCWICMLNWPHSSHCNRFENGSIDETDVARAKRDLDRYLHHYNRYHAHDQAQVFAQKQLEATAKRIERLQKSSVTVEWLDVEVLKAANEQLVECRRVLKYTYIFGYYFDNAAEQAATSTGTSRRAAASSSHSGAVTSGSAGKGDNQNVNTSSWAKMARERFEYHQEMLERFTESLSELSEKPEGEMNRAAIVNQTRSVDKFVKNILQYVEDGMEADFVVGTSETNPSAPSSPSKKRRER
jgi:ariadne-1